MGGFRAWLEKAVAVDDDDNTNHLMGEQHQRSYTIDYAKFKQRLKYFARRRSQIRNMIRTAKDSRISEQVLVDLLGSNSNSNNSDSKEATELTRTTMDLHPPMNVVHVPSYSKPTTLSAHDYVELVDNEINSHDRSNDANRLSCSDGGADANNTGGDDDAYEAVDHASLASEVGRKTKRHSQRSTMRRVSVAERNEVTTFLDSELNKVSAVYQAKWQALSVHIEKQQQQELSSSKNDQMDINSGAEESSRALAEEILDLLAYVTINAVTAQQILIRYDAYARLFDGTTPMRNYYMKKVSKYPTAYRQLWRHSEWHVLADSWLHQQQQQQHHEQHSDEHHNNSIVVEQFQAQRTMFHDILNSIQTNTVAAKYDDKGSSDQFSTTAGTITFRDKLVYSVRRWFLLGLFEDRLGLEPAFLIARGQSLTAQMERLAAWRQEKLDASGVGTAARRTKTKKLSPMQVFHLTLNLLSAFLYCMNYYIVEPSSTMYVNRLGAHDAMSGTLIGMMPLAAFVSSIPYSMWTNRSFRYPFLMSCVMLVLGNMLYSLADQFGVVSIALLGRFVAGLGAPKCIIRRYMADTTPVSLRTSVNAGFGMVVAAGSAMGPAMAIVLNKFEYTVAFRPIGIVTLNGLTLPGYFMATLWLTFGIIVLATFEEPDREGLKEQQELELKGGIPCSPSNLSANSNSPNNDDVMTIFSGESSGVSTVQPLPFDRMSLATDSSSSASRFSLVRWSKEAKRYLELITLPVRLCLGLLFCKVFTIESLVSATSALSKNRYKWQVQQVGTLGLTNGLLVIPFSILVGRLSLSYQDQVLMKWLVGIGCFGMFMLIDLSDLVSTPTGRYNEGHVLAVSPIRYIFGYFTAYISIQAFEGVIGSTLSKVIPTALASGTFNSGLLATLVDTFGRACGDLFISAAGFVSLRQLMNLLFIPGFTILFACLIIVERYRDLLSV